MISAIIPAYNEADNLGKCVAALKNTLDSLPEDYEIIISEDGSTDGTDNLAERLADDPKVIHLHSETRLGKGRSISKAFEIAKGDILLFLDADMSADLEAIPRMIDSLRNGFHIAIGSRMLHNSKTNRSFTRTLFSRAYNSLVRTLFGLPLSDIQCGFKAFDRQILEILPIVMDKGFFWDTELIIKATASGLRTREIAISWNQSESSKVSPFSDSLKFLYKVIKLRLSYKSAR